MINQCGVINKTTLDCLNSEFRSHERVNQAWMSQNANDWFNWIAKKEEKNSIKAYIKDLYPSINEKLGKRALEIFKEKEKYQEY